MYHSFFLSGRYNLLGLCGVPSCGARHMKQWIVVEVDAAFVGRILVCDGYLLLLSNSKSRK